MCLKLFPLVLFANFRFLFNHRFMAQVQWQNYDTTIILFSIRFWWGAKTLQRQWDQSSDRWVLQWEESEDFLWPFPPYTQKKLTGGHWEIGRTSLKIALGLILFCLLKWILNLLIGKLGCRVRDIQWPETWYWWKETISTGDCGSDLHYTR